MTFDVVELFAGVGGFRLGLEGPPGSRRDAKFRIVMSNQWEPSTKVQHAAEIYTKRWDLHPSEYNSNHYISQFSDDDLFINEDIAKIKVKDIPKHDLLVGGFPCQDYSVAKTLDKAKGLQGKKGVLWWEIHRIIKSKKPKSVLLENVDRLIKSPVKQRGRDFAVMLSCLSELDYVVQWRVINAAEYGMPQRRRRIFILAHKKGTKEYKKISKNILNIKKILTEDGIMAQAFPVIDTTTEISSQELMNEGDDIADLSLKFNLKGLPGNKSPFENTGLMFGNRFWTLRTTPDYVGEKKTLRDILLTPGKVPDEYFISTNSLTQTKGWQYLKGAKKELRQGRDGFTYNYNEGGMIFPDALDRPSRTIITGEGGSSPSRFKHVVKIRPTKKQMERLSLDSEEHNHLRKSLSISQKEWIRRLTPIELERLNQFPDGHTSGVSDAKRAFFMGNALVIGIIERFAEFLD
jgi:DNA (cytosine-5)-methyltransferase 1|tara:strand:+ start:1096 stop:2481 length:1386 start_codon:yes stop_codon:yes gene_type:complete